MQGATVSFEVLASGTTPLSYQWRWKDTNIDQATNFFYTISNIQPNQAGKYTVVITNVAGSVTSEVAQLTILCLELRLRAVLFSSQGFQFRLIDPPGRYVIEASTNCGNWLQIPVTLTPHGDLLDAEAGRLPRRFYRARYCE